MGFAGLFVKKLEKNYLLLEDKTKGCRFGLFRYAS